MVRYHLSLFSIAGLLCALIGLVPLHADAEHLHVPDDPGHQAADRCLEQVGERQGQDAAHGIRVDTDGNVWCGWGWGGPDTNGVRVHAPNGDAIAFLHTPEMAIARSNVCAARWSAVGPNLPCRILPRMEASGRTPQPNCLRR